MNILKNLVEAWNTSRDNDDMEEEDLSIAVPKTITPWGRVITGNAMVLAVVWLIVSILLIPFSTRGDVWAGFVTLATLGAMIGTGGIAVDIPDWHAGILFNPLTKRRRVVFQGLQWKLLWEHLEDEDPLTSLKREVSSEKVVTLPTNDPTETMEVTILIHIRVKTSGTPREDARNIIRFHSVNEDARTLDVEAEVVKMFSSHYSDKKEGEMENLLDARAVQARVLENKEDETNANKLNELEERYGIHIRIVLKRSNPDERTKKLKETPARAEALHTARHKLMRTGPNGEEPMEGKDATRASLLLDGSAEYSEHLAKWDVDLHAEGLENLENFSVIPPSTIGGGEKKGGKKKS